MAPKIVRDEYGRPFFLHDAEDAWKVSDHTVSIDWGTWEPVAFSGIDFTATGVNEPGAEPKNTEITVTEAVIQEAYNLVGNLNDLMLEEHSNWERAKVYEFISDVSVAAQLFLENIKGIEK